MIEIIIEGYVLLQIQQPIPLCWARVIQSDSDLILINVQYIKWIVCCNVLLKFVQGRVFSSTNQLLPISKRQSGKLFSSNFNFSSFCVYGLIFYQHKFYGFLIWTLSNHKFRTVVHLSSAQIFHILRSTSLACFITAQQILFLKVMYQVKHFSALILIDLQSCVFLH